jgi:hypothetical protein
MLQYIEAVTKAIEYLKSIYENPENILLEEIELSDDKAFWLITLSFDNPLPQNTIEIALGKNRLFRTIEVYSINGEVKSMKIKKL